MSGTNAIAVKTALLGVLKTAIAPVRIDEAYNSRLEERKYVYFGHTNVIQEPMVFRAGARMVREETLDMHLDVVVKAPAGTTTDTEAAIAVIAQQIEEALANDPTFAALQVPGLLMVWVSAVILKSGYNDNEAVSTLEYTINAQSKLG